MRKFFLTNAAGERWNLMRFDAFFHAPDGLGFSQTISSARVGTDYLETDAYLDQHTISGEMVLLNYEVYQQFVAFAMRSPLVLTYMPELTEYFIRCKVQSIGKTEIGSANRLICPITLLCSGTWFEREQAYYQNEPDVHVVLTGNVVSFETDQPITLDSLFLHEDDSITVEYTYSPNGGKIYNYTYNYIYSDSALGGVTIQNGAVESPLIVSILGAANNPTWSLTQDGVVIASGAVTAEIPEGHKLVIDARPSSMEIAEYTNSGVYVRDLYPMSDFSTARFLYAPAGESTVTVNAGGDSINTIVEVERYAYTV